MKDNAPTSTLEPVHCERTLRLFKRRVDALFACDLASRDDALTLGTKIEMTLWQDTSTGRTWFSGMRLTIPPREQVAYALTLLRPLTLKNDDLRWRKVLDALRFFCPSGDSLNMGRIAELHQH